MGASRRTRRPSRRRALVFSAMGLLVVAAAGYAVSRSGLFAASSIVVDGNVHLSRGQVLRLAKVGPDTNLLWFSPGAVEEQLEASPWVLSATVERAFPSSLTLSVVERAAVAVAGSPNGFLVAADRTVLGRATRDARLPFIDTGQASLTAGERLQESGALLAAVAALPDSVRGQVGRVRWDEDGVLTMTLRAGAKVIYGDVSHLEEKGLALEALLRWADRHDVVPAALDVRAPSRPALLPEGASAEPTIVTSR